MTKATPVTTTAAPPAPTARGRWFADRPVAVRLGTAVGAMALVAQFVEYAFARWRTTPERFQRIATIFLLFTHAIVGPFSLPFTSYSVTIFGKIIESGHDRLPLDASIADKSIFIVNPPFDAYVWTIQTIQSSRHAPVARHIWGLNTGVDAMQITRVNANTLDVSVSDKLFPPPYGMTYRSPGDGWKVGDEVDTADFTARVLAISDDGHAQSMRYTFGKPLDDATYLWYYFATTNLEPFTPPRVGETITTRQKTILTGLR